MLAAGLCPGLLLTPVTCDTARHPCEKCCAALPLAASRG